MIDIETATLKECTAALSAYGYRLDRWPQFERDAPVNLVDRAREYVSGQHDPHVAWDPSDDADGWLLVSSEALDIARETCGMIADQDPDEGPLATV